MKSTSLLPPTSSADNFSFERALYQHGYLHIAGCDEVGRGPLAGPVLAACVILPQDCDHSVFQDSKVLSHHKRLLLADSLKSLTKAWGIGLASWEEIDQINILQASLLAMKRAVQNMPGSQPNYPDYILVDGKFEIPLVTAQKTLIKGESKSGSIAAASILAKVARDQLMDEYHERFPCYNFARNKGYPTKEHRQALREYGPCSIHRLSFRGVKEYVR